VIKDAVLWITYHRYHRRPGGFQIVHKTRRSNMKRTTNTLIAAAVLAATATGTVGLANAHDGYRETHHMASSYGPRQDCDSPWRTGYGPGGVVGASALADRLDLSKEQRKKIRDVMDKARAKSRELGEDMYRNREDMQDTMTDKGYGPEYDKLAHHQGELIGDMMVLRAKVRADVEAVLDDDQKKEYRKLSHGFPGHRFGGGGWDWYGD
jgi:Spy/CpxP family protein refolding chaperone